MHLTVEGAHALDSGRCTTAERAQARLVCQVANLGADFKVIARWLTGLSSAPAQHACHCRQQQQACVYRYHSRYVFFHHSSAATVNGRII